jgi:SAM-dependent methyltransferase
MPRLLLVKLETPLDAASPEARFQLEVVRTEAAKVWSDVELFRLPVGDAPPGDFAACEVLLVGTGTVLLTHRTLAAMAAAVSGGATAAVPWLLTDWLASSGEPPPYTLRGFEAHEDRVLAGATPSAAAPATLLPVSLLASSVAAEALAAAVTASTPAGGGAATGSPAGDAPAPAGTVRTGLVHAFADYYGEVREDVLPFVPPAAGDVLEIGCATGGTGAFLQARLGCRVTGVDLSPAAAAVAATRLHRVLCGDVTTLEIDGRYDAVVALELFEHLPAAEEALLRLAALVRPGGRIILSVPNVGHHAVVSDLLAGRWDYLPIGLLCYTHFRFFTRRTLADWLERLGFRSFELVAQRTELPAELAGEVAGLELDRDSLATKGFYVLIDV